MKKVLLVLGLGLLALTSCKKDYTCTCEVGGVESSVEYEGLSKDEADEAEAACTTSDECTWSEN